MARPPQPPREITHVPLGSVSEDATFRLRQPGDISSLARSIAQIGQLFPLDVRPAGEGYQAITGFRRLAALRLLHRDRVLVRIHPQIADESAALVAAADALDTRALEREELLEMKERYRGMGWSSVAVEEMLQRALEKADERLEDLAATLRGEAPPDRSIADEDAIEDAEAQGLPAAAKQPPGAEKPPAREQEPAREPEPEPTEPALRHEPSKPPEEPPAPARLGRPHRRAPAPQAEERELTVPELARDVALRLSAITQDVAALADVWSEVPADLQAIITDQLQYYRQLGTWLEQQAEGDTP